MEALMVLAYLNLFMFAVSGLLFVGAINKYVAAVRTVKEARDLALRAILIRNKR